MNVRLQQRHLFLIHTFLEMEGGSGSEERFNLWTTSPGWGRTIMITCSSSVAALGARLLSHRMCWNPRLTQNLRKPRLHRLHRKQEHHIFKTKPNARVLIDSSGLTGLQRRRRRETSPSERGGGGAMRVGTGWRATDGVEDAHRVGQSAPRPILHGVYLEDKDTDFILRNHAC